MDDQGQKKHPDRQTNTTWGLNSVIKTAKLRGWLSGFEVDRNGGNNMEVTTHLQYADDTPLFYVMLKKDNSRF